MKIEKDKGGTPKNFWIMLGSGRKYHHSKQNRKANNFVVTGNSWKWLWKKLQDFEKILLVQNIFLHRGGEVNFEKFKNDRICSIFIFYNHNFFYRV